MNVTEWLVQDTDTFNGRVMLNMYFLNSALETRMLPERYITPNCCFQNILPVDRYLMIPADKVILQEEFDTDQSCGKIKDVRDRVPIRAEQLFRCQ